MGLRIRGRGRTRWVIVFALLLFACSAVPAFGSSSPEPPLQESFGSEPAPSVQPPTGDDIAEGIAKLEREEAEQAKQLAAPDAKREREASREAYAGIGPEEATRLLNAQFSEQLAALNGEPARFLSDATLTRSLGERGAEVVNPEGEKQLLEASIPIRAKNNKGELRKVDLSLKRVKDGYEPDNPLVDLSIGESASEGVAVGDRGLAISQVGAEEAGSSRRFGDKNIFFSEVREGSDTDQLVSPTATGVEIFDQLRSVNSPETLRFHLQLPADASLRSDDANGAEITTAKGTLFAEVPAPSAIDAQGTPVPVSLEVEGSAIVLRLRHREADLAYPILVDPELKVLTDSFDWESGSDLSGLANWSWSTNDGTQFEHSTSCIFTCWGSHRGLYVSSVSGTIPANSYGQWYYSGPGTTTYIPSIYPTPSATVGLHRDNHGCNWEPYPQPHDYDGVWDGEKWDWLETDRAQWYGGDSMYTKGGKVVVVGLSTGAKSIAIPCWRDIDTGSVSVWLDDPESPTLTSVSGMPSSSTWLGKNKAITVEATATDAGLGVQKILARGGAESIWEWDQSSCSGLWSQRCGATRTGKITFNTNGLFQGEASISVQPLDPTGKGAGTQEYPLLVDREGPLIDLSGQLANITEEEGTENLAQEKGDDELSLPTYKLNIEATDAKPGQVRSGVKEVDVYLDGGTSPVASESQSCPLNSCSMSLSYTLKLHELAPGAHTLKVTAIDWAGNEATPERKIDFEYIPATGEKDEYVLQHIPLPDGQDHSEEEKSHGPELAVNVINGNLVYHERDFQVKARDANLELERFYNSQLPAEKSGEWGEGWTAAQMPELTPEESEAAPSEATMVQDSGAIDNDVEIPETEEQQTFNPELHATINKTPKEGYEVEYGDKEEEPVFDVDGQIEETRYPSGAAIAYGYTGDDQPDERYVRSFGSAGEEGGQFDHPADVAVDSSGNLWVVDSANDRVEKFNAEDEFQQAFGTAGSGNGQLNRPTSIALTSGGNIWVADSANDRIEEFNAKGEYLAKVGSHGTGNSQFVGPEGVAIDPSGNIWVADTGNGRVQEFNSSGTFIRVVSSKGAAAGQLGEPTDIAIDPTGNAWVADWLDNRVVEFSGGGTYAGQLGAPGSGEGQFHHPAAIAVDSKGEVWVGDQNNGRIEEFSNNKKYLAQYGAKGSRPGQFSFGYPMGLTTDSKGDLWVADTNHNQIQQWLIPNYLPTYSSSFGSEGAGPGQFNQPAGIVINSKGNLLVLDKENNRVEEFDKAGEYLAEFGSEGSEDGQLLHPSALALDAEGNIWIADTDNNRIEEFNEAGEYLSKFGSAGSGGGELDSPQGITVSPEGNIWVSDTGNGRAQEFSSAGEFINAVGFYPWELHTVRPKGITPGPSGSIWVVDAGNNRIDVIGSSGYLLGAVGNPGSGSGKFSWPTSINIDSSGNFWIGDNGNSRVQEMDKNFEYFAQFGSEGSEPGQFMFGEQTGIATDSEGNIWVTDTYNNRIQKFTQSASTELPAPTEYVTGMAIEDPYSTENPSVDIGVEEGLVSNVEGEEAGVTNYDYEAGRLTAKESEEGETTYGYDAGGRLEQIELPNGTTAEISYDSLARVTAVTVDPAGPEETKTTHFSYSAEPRQTTVYGGGTPEVTYSIGEDGSVFKWAYAEVAPSLELSGSLFEHANSPVEIPNKDQALRASATSPHQIEEIQILVNGNVAVDEKTCEDDHETPKLDCENVALEWITNPASHPAGRLDVEAIATDFLGNSVSEHFFVTIPQQEPPDPEAPTPPTFAATKQFLEEFGLDKGLWGEEEEFNQFIFERLGDYEDQNEPAAQKSVAQWGVPLAASDIEEMEYRERYIAQAATVIPQWAETHSPSTYAGYYVDHRSGGIIRVGFTKNQAALVSQLKEEVSLMAPGRVEAFSTPPTRSLSNLQELQGTVIDAVAAPESPAGIISVDLDIEHNGVKVGAGNVTLASNYLTETIGSQPALSVHLQTDVPSEYSGRYQTGHPFLAGEEIQNSEGICTAGFGAWSKFGATPNGVPIKHRYVLTAGHCFSRFEFTAAGVVFRAHSPLDKDPVEIGEVERRAFHGDFNSVEVDAEAIWLDDPSLVPGWIYECCGGKVSLRPTGVAYPQVGQVVCTSGVKSDAVLCGPVIEEASAEHTENSFTHVVSGLKWLVHVGVGGGHGDSGAPAWLRDTGAAVGLVEGGDSSGLLITPLRRPPNAPPGQTAGILSDPEMSPTAHPLHVQIDP